MQRLLERPFGIDEIEAAVTDCEGNKAPGRDGYNFVFFKHFWDLFKEQVVKMMNELF
jgi:hypothetical protein